MAPSNTLPVHGNEKTMNLNPLVLTNIQSSPYFKVNLFELKTYHEVIDEIYYKVSHLEPWEKGSRKTAGQTGMCGGVRGVGAGGIVSSAFCLLYKLYTLKLTRKQLTGLLNHADSPYIRGLGFMYIRFSQPPADFWEWFSPYFEDEEEIDVKAGGGHTITIGELSRQFLTKLEWYATLFPRIPVPVQKDLDVKLKGYDEEVRVARLSEQGGGDNTGPGDYPRGGGGADARGGGGGAPGRDEYPESRRSPSYRSSDADRDRHRRPKSRSRSRDRRRSRSRDKRRSRSRDKSRRHRSRSKDRRHRSRSRERHRGGGGGSGSSRSSAKSSSHSSRRGDHRSSRAGREDSFERDLQRERERQRRDRERHN